jgi:hypothetical protein
MEDISDKISLWEYGLPVMDSDYLFVSALLFNCCIHIQGGRTIMRNILMRFAP